SCIQTSLVSRTLRFRISLDTSFYASSSLTLRPPPPPTLFPYTTLFRSLYIVVPVIVAQLWRAALLRTKHGALERTLQVLQPVSQIGRAHVELQSRENLVCRLLLEKQNFAG